MDSLRSTYRVEDDDDGDEEEFVTATKMTASTSNNGTSGEPLQPTEVTKNTIGEDSLGRFKDEEEEEEEEVEEEEEEEEEEEDEEYHLTEDEDWSDCEVKPLKSDMIGKISENLNLRPGRIYEEDESEDPPTKKQKPVSSLNVDPKSGNSHAILTAEATVVKNSKKKNSNGVSRKPSSKKGKKKGKAIHINSNNHTQANDAVLLTPVPRFFDKNDDSEEMNICLSKVYKAEKMELSDDRMCASSAKGYRMVRTTRGVEEGAWYFEIIVVQLGETGHTRLGWSTEKGDLQAPVGYDGNSFGYRDIDGCKIHKALREKFGDEGYGEGDVIGFYINLPEGKLYVPKLPHLYLYRGQKCVGEPNANEDPPKNVPGSEIRFFKNGVCQGVAFTELFGGRYYPAASMYTLPNQPNGTVRFNFGPHFKCFPECFDDCPLPRPMIEAPYQGFESKVRVDNGDNNPI